MDMKELSSILQQNGIVGAGGAGFPTYAKLDERAETIILNCAECEPLLRLHRQLLEKYAKEIIDTFHMIGETVGAKEVIIGIKKAYTATIEAVKAVMGQVVLNSNSRKHKVELLTIIGEVEGHESAPSHSKTTKYEHVLPKLAIIEDDEEIEGLLILLNTVGGDVEAGLAIAEMIASLSIPTVSLVLGGGHSIGVPMAVSADYSFAVPSATMVIHPVRSNGMFIGVTQTYRNMEKIQDRITTFISEHSKASQKRLEELMLDTSQLVKDVGTMLEGKEAVKEGLIDEVGGIKEALAKLYEMIEKEC